MSYIEKLQQQRRELEALVADKSQRIERLKQALSILSKCSWECEDVRCFALDALARDAHQEPKP